MSFVEEFDCGSCESEDVFSISSSEFTTVNDFSGPWGWMPQFDIIEKSMSTLWCENQFFDGC